MPFDIREYHNQNLDYYGDVPLEEVGKDIFERGGYSKKFSSFDEFSKAAGIEQAVLEDRRRRNPPTFFDKLREGVAHVAPGLEEIPKGLQAGVQQVKGMGHGLTALAGAAVGSDTLLQMGAEGLKKVEAETPKPAVGSISDVGSIADAGKYLAYGVSANLPNMLLSLASGGVGGVLGKKAATEAAAKILKTAGMDRLKRKAADEAARQVVRKAITRGAVTGAATASIGMEAGSIAGDQLTETGEVQPGRVMAGAIPAGLLDVVPEWYLAKKLGWIGKGAAEFTGNRLTRAAKVAASQFAVEAPTEAMQSVIERSAVPGKSITNADAWDEYINSFILGGMTGAVVGGAGGIFTKKAGELTPEQDEQLERLKKGALLTMAIHKGMEQGTIGNDPFTPDDAIKIIREGRKAGVYTDEDVERFGERYPALKSGLNEVRVDSVKEKITEAVMAAEKGGLEDEQVQTETEVAAVPGAIPPEAVKTEEIAPESALADVPESITEEETGKISPQEEIVQPGATPEGKQLSIKELAKKSDELQAKIDAKHDELEAQGLTFEQQNTHPDLTALYNERIGYDTQAAKQGYEGAKTVIENGLSGIPHKSLYVSVDSILREHYRLDNGVTGAYELSKVGEALDDPKTIENVAKDITKLLVEKDHPGLDFYVLMEHPASALTREGKEAYIKEGIKRAEKINSGIKDFFVKQSPEVLKDYPDLQEAKAAEPTEAEAPEAPGETLGIETGQPSAPGGIVQPGAKEANRTIVARENKEPWEMTRDEFKAAVTRGKLYRATGKPAPHKIGSQKTPLSLGESEGYPASDIAANYVARRTLESGLDKSTEPGVFKVLSRPKEEDIDIGREEYIRDALLEGKPVPPEVLKDYPDLAKRPTTSDEETAKSLAEVKRLREDTDRLLKEGGYNVHAKQPQSEKGERNLYARGYRPYLTNKEGTALEINVAGTWAKAPKGETKAPVPEKQPVQPPMEAEGTRGAVEKPPAETVVEPPPEANAPAPEKKVTTPKEQKKYLVSAIDEALKDAPDKVEVARKRGRPINSEDATGRNALPYESEKDEKTGTTHYYASEIDIEKTPTVRIEVPGDGTFTIVNDKPHLEAFKKMAAKFPVGEKKSVFVKPKTEPTGKRIAEEGVEYYNEFKPREHALITSPENKDRPEATQNHYDATIGWYSNGHYAIKTEKPKGIVYNGKVVDVKKVIPTGDLVAAKIVGEFHTGRGDSTREDPQAHIVAEDGTESVVNAHYLDAILTKYPNAKVFLKAGENNLNKVLFKDKGKMVALLMPIVEGEVRVRETFADRIAEITRKKEHEAAAAKEPEDKEVHGGADFVAAPDGSINFGEITPDISKSISRSAAPIRLTNERLKYIESNHREQIMSAGYDSVQSFIGDVVSGYSEIREGKGNTLLIAKGEEKKRIVFIELKPDESGNYYTINNAYPARPGYVESKNLLWSSAQSSSARKPEPSLKRQEESSNERIVQEEKKVKGKETAEGIQDFGEKLGGARKDMNIVRSVERDITDDDLANMAFSEIWPKSEVDSIEDPDLAALATALRNEIPFKPRVRHKVRRWVESVKLVRTLMKYANEKGFDAIMQRMSTGEYERTLDQFTNKVNLLRQLPREHWDRIGKVRNYPDAMRYQTPDEVKEGEKPTTVPEPYAYAEVDGRLIRGKNLDDLPGKVLERIGATEKPTLQFEIRIHRGENDAFINKKGDPLYRALKTFTGKDAVEQARNFLKNNQSDLVNAWEAVKESDNVKETDVRRKENKPRTGKDHRQGKDATPEMFTNAFGFRGVEFGNWVAQGKNAKERQGMMNMAYDALMDLADILHVPPKALSLNGTLGIGFGSRGHGWASAHYEPDTVVINLTKTRGAGTFAHEFFHALDNYFQRKRGGPSIIGREGRYITYGPESYYEHIKSGQKLPASRFREIRDKRWLKADEWKRGSEAVRPEVEESFAALVKALDDSPMRKRSKLIDKGGSGYWSRIIERAARAFENYVIFKMHQQGYENDYLANVVTVENFPRDLGRYPYLLDEELKSVAEAFDNLFSTIQTRETEKGVEMYSRGARAGQSASRESEEINAEIDAIVKTAKANGTYLKAPNGEDTKLTPGQWAKVRTSRFKQWFGDWEAAEKYQRIMGLKAIPISDNSVSEDDALATYTKLKSTTNKIDKREIFFVNSIFGKLARHKERSLIFRTIPQLEEIVANAQPAYSEEERKPGIHNNIIGYNNYVSKARIDGQDYYVRLTVQEVRKSQGNELHNLFLSNIEINKAGSMSNPSGLTAPYGAPTIRSTTSLDNKLTSWLAKVKSDYENSSKVTDDNGEPMVVYHGTYADFNQFNTRRSRANNRLGGYFTEDHDAASVFAVLHGSEGGRILPVHLNMEKPLDLRGIARENIAATIGYPENVQREMETQGRAGAYATLEWLDKRHELIPRLKRKGYDGIVFNSENEGTTWVAFSPTQIKSATGNIGTFGKETDDIRYSRKQKQGDLFEGTEPEGIEPTSTRGWSLSDVQEIFKGQEVVQTSPNGPIFIKMSGGKYLTINSVDHISPKEVNFRMAYGRKIDEENETITGAYGEGNIRLVQGKAGKWTLHHESVHALIDAGIISEADYKLLSHRARILVKFGKMKGANKEKIGGEEDIANLIADIRAGEREEGTAIGRIVQKILDFIDNIMAAFGKRTAGGVVRDIRSGKIYERGLNGTEKAATSYAVTPKKGTGENIPPKTTQSPRGRRKLGDEGLPPEGVTAEDFELNPTKMSPLKKGYVSFLQDGKVYSAKIGENGIYNHADLGMANGLDFDKAIPGFLDKKGNFVEQYPSPNPSRPPESGGRVQYSVEKILNNPAGYKKASKEVSGSLKEKISNEVDLLIQEVIYQVTPDIHRLGNLKKFLTSPEWYEHPVFSKIVRLFTRDREELYNEYYNHLTNLEQPMMEENTVGELALKLKHKGLSMAERLSGETSKEYQDVLKIIDEADINNVTYSEENLKKQGYSDDTISVWRGFRESYDKALDLLTAQMRAMIEAIEEEAAFKGVKPVDYSEMYQTLKGALAQMGDLRGSYAPRTRQGNWAVTAYRGDEENREHYREHRFSHMAAKRLARSLEAEGWTIDQVKEVDRLSEDVYQDLKTVSVAKAIETAIDNMTKGKGEETQNQAVKFNEEILREVADMIRARGFRSTMIRRTKGAGVIKGYIEDPIERHSIYTSNVSRGLAKAKVAGKAMELFAGTKEKGEQVGGINPKKEPQIYSAAKDYIEEQLRNMDRADRTIAWAKSLASLKFLGFSARSAVVNLTAIVTTAPASIHQYVTEGRVSFGRINKALALAGKDSAKFMTGKFQGDKDEMLFLNEQKRLGWDNPQYTRDMIAKIGSTGNRAWAMTMDGAMWMFGKTEQWNRLTTMLAAYRLARASGKDHAQASELAKTASDKAHGIYGRSTLPSIAWGRNPAAKMAQMLYTFSKFAHNYMQMLYDLGFRKHNWKAFSYALLTPVLLSGVSAWPLKDAVFMPLIGVLLSILGIKDRDRDTEKWIWDLTRKYLGTGAEGAGRYGAMGALGFDISGSLSIGVGLPKNIWEWGGAIGGVVKEGAEALDEFGQGNTGRAVEKLLPSGLANPLRAAREAGEGISTQNKRRVWDESGKPFMPVASETARRALGFRSTRQAVLSQRTWEGHRQQARFTEMRNEIYEQFRSWLLSGGKDRARYAKIIKEAREYNAKIRDLGIQAEVPPITTQAMRNQMKRTQAPTKRERALLM